MIHIFLIQLTLYVAFTLSAQGQVKMDRIHSEAYLGEKRLDSYSSRWQPLVFMDLYQGKMAFEDELFFQNYFQNYLFDREKDFSSFF